MKRAGYIHRLCKDVPLFFKIATLRHASKLYVDRDGQPIGAQERHDYVIRKFCLEKKTNVFLVSEQLMQQKDNIRDLIYRLLDYRIVHSAGTALTHKSQTGTYQAFAIDIGCYGHLRKHDGKFNEIDMSDANAKEKMRSAPVLDGGSFEAIWSKIPASPITELLNDEVGEAA